MAGLFAVNRASHASTTGRGEGSLSTESLPALSRVRPAKGAVKHNTVG